MNKNFNKIPSSINIKLKNIPSKLVVVGYARAFSAEFFKKGGLGHLGVTLAEKGLIYPKNIIPLATQGKYSKRNRHGEEIIRKDLPLETHYRSVEAPDWKGYGTHSVNLPYEKYPRDFIAPALISIKIEAPQSKSDQESYIIKFELSEVLNKDSKDFNERLLAGLNILQENTGYIGIQAAGTTLAEYIQTLSVAWEILPPGSKEDVIARISRGRSLPPEEREEIEDRYDFFMKLNPANLIYGSSGFLRYFGAMINERLVVFENIEYGNAVYIMFENWQLLSKRSRIELLSGRFGSDFERIPHIKGWKEKVLQILRDKRKS